MKLFSDCSSCETCACGDGLCLAGIGDNDYAPASVEQVIERLDNNKWSDRRDKMIQYLKEKFNYDYEGVKKMKESELTFKRNLLKEMRIVTIADGATHDNSDIDNRRMVVAVTVNQELNNFGYTLKPEDIVRLAKCDISEITILLNEFKEIVGDVKAKPMYPNFPFQVMEMDEATFRFHQLCHYFSTYGIEALTGEEVIKGWLPNVEDTEKTKYDKSLLDLKVLDLWSYTYAIDFSILRLLSKNERLTLPEMEIIKCDIKLVTDDVFKTLNIPFKENMYELFYNVFTSNRFKEIELYKFCQHTGDIWKCIDYLMNEKGIKHFRTSQKRVLVKLLESYPVADFEANLILSNKSANKVKILLNYLDFNTYSRSPQHKEAVRKLRNKELQSWEGKAKALIFSKDTSALEFISKRPGIMLRMITLLLRNGYKASDISKALIESAGKLSTQTLVTLCTFFGMEELPETKKGEERDKFEVMALNAIFNECLEANLAAKDIAELKDKKVFLDMDNYNLDLSMIECNTKSEEGGYIRSGLAYKIPEDVKRIRLFVYWNDKNRVDVDLHASMINLDGTKATIGWNSNYKNGVAVFSGDITHSDAAEYIDIDLDKAKDIYSKANLNINLYSGRPSFGEIDECFVGIMAVNNIGEEVKLYDAKNCFFNHYLKGKQRCLEYGYIDIKNHCLVFIGKEGVKYSNNQYYKSSFSLGKYLDALFVSQNTELVENKEDADIILTMEKSTDDKAISLLDNNFFMER